MDRPLVIVTGGAGFIGSHVVDALLAGDARVAVVDNFSTGKRENLAQHATSDRLAIVEHDIATELAPALAPVEERWGRPSLIIHLAAQVSVVTSLARPVFDMNVNYRGTLNVIDHARQFKEGARPTIVLASSAAVYGDVTEMPVGEDTPQQPLSPYGLHKLASEHALRAYASIHHARAAALRFFNVYGPRQDPSSPYSGVISIFADRARRGAPLTIFGDGTQTRDFVYVGDVVRGILAAAKHPEPFLIANVGTGTEITITELARAVVELCGSTSAIEYAQARPGEIVKSRARVDRLREQLGVVAQTSLVDGLRATLA